MNRPPLWMRLQIQNRDKDKDFGLWLPLFLLIPVAVVVFIILSPLILIAAIILWPSGWGKITLLSIPAAARLYCSIRGLQVNVRSARRGEQVYISVV